MLVSFVGKTHAVPISFYSCFDASSFASSLSLLDGISPGLIHVCLYLLLTAYGHLCGQRYTTDAFVRLSGFYLHLLHNLTQPDTPDWTAPHKVIAADNFESPTRSFFTTRLPIVTALSGTCSSFHRFLRPTMRYQQFPASRGGS